MAQQTGKNAESMDSAMHNKIAVGCICITAVAGAVQEMIAAKDSFSKHHIDRNTERNFKEFNEAINRKCHSRGS